MERVDTFEVCVTASGKDTKDAKIILLEMLRSLRPQERVVSFWKQMGRVLIHLPSSILQLFLVLQEDMLSRFANVTHLDTWFSTRPFNRDDFKL